MKNENTRGWLSLFLTLISNPYSEFSFHFENSEKIHIFMEISQNKVKNVIFSTNPNFENSFSDFFHSYDITKATVQTHCERVPATSHAF